MNQMTAIEITKNGGPEVLQLKTRARPEVTPGTVVIKVRAFGLNHAEIYFRKGAWGDVSPVSGIECVGEIVAAGTSDFIVGQRVFALMGGMGRSIPGSYAEFVRVPEDAVVAIESSLPFNTLAALPESYATAWTFLHSQLKCQRGEAVLIRGGTSALGQAALNLGRLQGLRVVATTRSQERFQIIEALGAQAVLEHPALANELRSRSLRIDAVMDIIGTSTLLDSLQVPHFGGRVAMAGFLGGMAPLVDFNPLAHFPSGVSFSFFASAFMFGTAACPLSGIPFQQFVDAAQQKLIVAAPAHVFAFDKIQEAHHLMESGRSLGKIVVEVAAA
jgi:NADPH:quinone reductase